MPVDPLLFCLPSYKHLVETYRSTHAEDHLRLVRDEHSDPPCFSLLRPAEDEARSRPERKVRVIDPCDEVAGSRKDWDRSGAWRVAGGPTRQPDDRTGENDATDDCPSD